MGANLAPQEIAPPGPSLFVPAGPIAPAGRDCQSLLGFSAKVPFAESVIALHDKPSLVTVRSQNMRNHPKKHVLYLVHRFPFPPDKGDRIRAFHIIEHLQDRCHLSIVTLDDANVPRRDVEALARYCHRLEVVPAARLATAQGLLSMARGGSATLGALGSKPFLAKVEQVASETPPDAVLLSTSGLADAFELPSLQQARKVVDFVDLDSQKWQDYSRESRGPMRMIYGIEARRLRAVESRLIRDADAITLVTDAERQLCETLCGTGAIHTVTNGVHPGPAPTATPSEPRLIFVGALDYRPNVEGIHWFCRHVWSDVRAVHPTAQLALVGRSPHPSLQQIRLPGVELIGPVPEIRPHLDAAAISISPLRIARGLQNKVLEAMAAGRPVVASRGAAEGIMAVPSRDLLVADSPAEWVAAIDQLIQNPQFSNQIGQAGRTYVENYHNWSTCLFKLPELLGLEGNLENTTKFLPISAPSLV